MKEILKLAGVMIVTGGVVLNAEGMNCSMRGGYHRVPRQYTAESMSELVRNFFNSDANLQEETELTLCNYWDNPILIVKTPGNLKNTAESNLKKLGMGWESVVIPGVPVDTDATKKRLKLEAVNSEIIKVVLTQSGTAVTILNDSGIWRYFLISKENQLHSDMPCMMETCNWNADDILLDFLRAMASNMERAAEKYTELLRCFYEHGIFELLAIAIGMWFDNQGPFTQMLLAIAQNDEPLQRELHELLEIQRKEDHELMEIQRQEDLDTSKEEGMKVREGYVSYTTYKLEQARARNKRTNEKCVHMGNLEGGGKDLKVNYVSSDQLDTKSALWLMRRAVLNQDTGGQTRDEVHDLQTAKNIQLTGGAINFFWREGTILREGKKKINLTWEIFQDWVIKSYNGIPNVKTIHVSKMQTRFVVWINNNDTQVEGQDRMKWDGHAWVKID